MKRLDRYIISEVALPLVGGFFFFSFMFLVMQVLRLSDSFFSKGVPAFVIAKVCAYLLITFMPYVIPISFLIAVLMAFGRLSSESEVVAIQASGWSLWRLLLPVGFVALLASALTMVVTAELAPSSERQTRIILEKSKQTQATKVLRQRTFVSGFFGLLVYANQVSENGGLEDVFIVDERGESVPMTIIAPTGQIIPVEQDSDFGSAMVLRLFRGEIHFNTDDPNQYEKINFNQYETYLEITESEAEAGYNPSIWTLRELLSRLDSDSSSRTKRYLRAELWRRIALGITPLAFALLGIGFGVSRMRSVRSSSAVIAFAVSALQWTSSIYMLKLARLETLPAPIAMLLPPLVFCIVGAVAIRRAT